MELGRIEESPGEQIIASPVTKKVQNAKINLTTATTESYKTLKIDLNDESTELKKSKGAKTTTKPQQ